MELNTKFEFDWINDLRVQGKLAWVPKEKGLSNWNLKEDCQEGDMAAVEAVRAAWRWQSKAHFPIASKRHDSDLLLRCSDIHGIPQLDGWQHSGGRPRAVWLCDSIFLLLQGFPPEKIQYNIVIFQPIWTRLFYRLFSKIWRRLNLG